MKKNICISTSVVLLLLVLFLHCPFGVEPDKTLSPLKEQDSLAVRAILDSNGLKDIDLSNYDDRERVLRQIDSSIYGLMLDTLNIKSVKFVKEFKLLENLEEITFTNNLIRNVYIEDTITFTKTLIMDLSFNVLDSFPEQLLKINNIEALYMYNNNIAYLPIEIMNKPYAQFYIRHNKLTNVPDTLKTWLSQYDPDWEKYQGF